MTAATPTSGGTNEQFIANIAQTLRYPLVPIRNAAALLKLEATDPATIRRVADIIERQTNGMYRLLGDLVDMSRLQMGTLALHLTRAPISRLVELAIEPTETHATEWGHTFAVSIAPKPIFMHMDVTRLAQALHHIIANACKYTDNHGHIFIRAQQEGLRAVITVSDSGVGILPSELEAIFGLFVQRGHGPRAEPGLGVGLYVARRLIEAHGGTVIAESAGPGRGSVFTVRLPCEAANALALESAEMVQATDRSPA